MHQNNKYAETHGYSKEPFYRLWLSLKDNAASTNQFIDPNWLDIHLFKEWLDSQGYQHDMILFLIDLTGGYSPQNCVLILKQDLHRYKYHRNKPCTVRCSRCNDTYTVKNGKLNGEQRYQCKACHFNFVLTSDVTTVTGVT